MSGESVTEVNFRRSAGDHTSSAGNQSHKEEEIMKSNPQPTSRTLQTQTAAHLNVQYLVKSLSANHIVPLWACEPMFRSEKFCDPTWHHVPYIDPTSEYPDYEISMSNKHIALH